MTTPTDQQAELTDRFAQQDLELSPALFAYRDRQVSLATARANTVQNDWAGDYLYVAELKGHLQVRFNNLQAPLLTLREGEVYKVKFQRVYLTNEGVAAWGTATIILGFGEFQVQPTPNRTPVVVYSATGSGALSLATAEGRRFRFLRATVKFNTKPTQDAVTLTLDANAGAAYDAVLARATPADGSGTGDVVFSGDPGEVFEAGDELRLEFANNDGRTFGALVYVSPA